MESITFNTAENKLIVTLTDGTTREYTSAEAYLADWPDRGDDVVAMGWNAPA